MTIKLLFEYGAATFSRRRAAISVTFHFHMGFNDQRKEATAKPNIRIIPAPILNGNVWVCGEKPKSHKKVINTKIELRALAHAAIKESSFVSWIRIWLLTL